MPARLKVLLFLVEGITDKTSLAMAMTRLISENNIQFEIMNGDVTADYRIASSAIAKEVGNRGRCFAKRQHFQAKDFYKVVHIIDSDAAFIPDSQILDMSLSSTLLGADRRIFYDSEQGIWTRNTDDMIRRNQLKQAKVNKLRTLSKVYRSVPYEIYYMSMNLEHVFYDQPNASREEKVKWANEKVEELMGDPQSLVRFFDSPHIALGGADYQESWNFIETADNSLKRCSNFNIFFDRARQDGILQCSHRCRPAFP